MNLGDDTDMDTNLHQLEKGVFPTWEIKGR
jgi:hypothetical protein